MNYYSDQPDPLIDENNDLKKALKQLQNTLDRTVGMQEIIINKIHKF